MDTLAYFPEAPTLEELLESAFVNSSVKLADRTAIKAFLGPLKVKGEIGRFHYEHSLRVGILARKLAKALGLPIAAERAMLFAGLLHDIGKALVPLDTLGKTDSWTEEDQRNIEPHVDDGFRMLRGKFDFSAQIMAWHHRFQPNCYPKEPAPLLHGYATDKELEIQVHGRLLMIADSFDAMHRVNFQYGKKQALSAQEIKRRMLENNKDWEHIVEFFYREGVLPMHSER
jgi:putative nucleotidyltransferase with HDIG domain